VGPEPPLLARVRCPSSVRLAAKMSVSRLGAGGIGLARHLTTLGAGVNATVESIEYFVQFRQKKAVRSALISGSPGEGFLIEEAVLPDRKRKQRSPFESAVDQFWGVGP
jgi:hypothetical protein